MSMFLHIHRIRQIKWYINVKQSTKTMKRAYLKGQSYSYRLAELLNQRQWLPLQSPLKPTHKSPRPNRNDCQHIPLQRIEIQLNYIKNGVAPSASAGSEELNEIIG